MTYRIIDVTQKAVWNELINGLPADQRDIYFTPEYYELYEKNGNGQACCFVFQHSGEIALYPFLKNSINSLGIAKLDRGYFDIQGAYGYNGVVSSCYDSDFITAFHKCFDEFCSEQNIIAEFTRFHPIIRNDEFSKDYMIRIKDRQTVFIDITEDYDTITGNYKASNRKKIRKALKNKFQITYSNDEESFKAFYQLYTETMNNANADEFYFFDWEYFKNFKELLKDNFILINISDEKELYASFILTYYGRYAHSCLSARNIELSKFGANNLAHDLAIQKAKELGCENFHMGGGTTSNPDDPLLYFKSGYSRTLTDFYIGKRVHDQKIYEKVCREWEKNNQERAEKYKHFLLRYRH